MAAGFGFAFRVAMGGTYGAELELTQQQVGSLFNLIRKYVDRVQNPDKTQAPKNGGKKEEKAESSDPIVVLQGFAANAVKMVDVTDVDRFKDSAFEMIACLRRIRKV